MDWTYCLLTFVRAVLGSSMRQVFAAVAVVLGIVVAAVAVAVAEGYSVAGEFVDGSEAVAAAEFVANVADVVPDGGCRCVGLGTSAVVVRCADRNIARVLTMEALLRLLAPGVGD